MSTMKLAAALIRWRPGLLSSQDRRDYFHQLSFKEDSGKKLRMIPQSPNHQCSLQILVLPTVSQNLSRLFKLNRRWFGDPYQRLASINQKILFLLFQKLLPLKHQERDLRLQFKSLERESGDFGPLVNQLLSVLFLNLRFESTRMYFENEIKVWTKQQHVQSRPTQNPWRDRCKEPRNLGGIDSRYLVRMLEKTQTEWVRR